MMKHTVRKTVIVAFALCLVFAFSSCANTDTPEDTNETTETTDITETTAPQDTAWKPDPSMRWLYVPACLNEEDGHTDDEIKLTLEESVFAEAPDDIRVTIRRNKVAEDPYYDVFYLCLHPYYEKTYSSIDVGYDYEMGWPYPMWVRLPISTGKNAHVDEVSFANPEQTEFTMSFSFASAVKDERLELTPGQYRLVLYAGDGPHYAYFQITG